MAAADPLETSPIVARIDPDAAPAEAPPTTPPREEVAVEATTTMLMVGDPPKAGEITTTTPVLIVSTTTTDRPPETRSRTPLPISGARTTTPERAKARR